MASRKATRIVETESGQSSVEENIQTFVLNTNGTIDSIVVWLLLEISCEHESHEINPWKWNNTREAILPIKYTDQRISFDQIWKKLFEQGASLHTATNPKCPKTPHITNMAIDGKTELDFLDSF